MLPGFCIAHIAGAEFSPADFGADLVAWFDASDPATLFEAASDLAEDADTLTIWADKSGNDNHLYQATSGNRPTYDADGFNGLPTVMFTAANSTHMEQSSSSGGTNVTEINETALSVFGVFAINTASNSNARVLKFHATGQLYDYDNFASLSINRAGEASSMSCQNDYNTVWIIDPVTFGVPMRFAFTVETGLATTYLNNSSLTTDTTGVVPDFADGKLGMGFLASGSFLDGKVSEFVLVKRPLTTQERNDLDAYFVAKWGF